MMELKRYVDDLLKCSHCGSCEATCPVFLEDLLESHVARSRIRIIDEALLQKNISVTPRVKEIIDRCLLCTNCNQICAGGVPVDEIVIAARYQIYKGKRQNLVRRQLMKQIMQNRGLKGVLKNLESIATKIGLNSKDIPNLPSKTFSEVYQGRYTTKNAPRYRVAYYVGCATNMMYPETGAAVLDVLTHNGIEVIIPDGLVCCGVPAMAEGDLKTAKELVSTNLRILEKMDVDAIITDCTSCGLMFNSKALKIVDPEEKLHSTDQKISGQIREVTDYLNEIGLIHSPTPLEKRYTYHIPCHRGWTKTLDEAPQTLLAQIPQAEYTPLKNAKKCCGAAGGFFLDNRELSDRILSKKTADIASTEADVVITQCPSCRTYINNSLKDSQSVVHPISLLAEAYGFNKSGYRSD